MKSVHEIWRTEPEGVLSAEINGLRLVVEAVPEVGGSARFRVLCRGAGERSDDVIDSGIRPGVRAAMAAAEQVARKYASQAGETARLIRDPLAERVAVESGAISRL